MKARAKEAVAVGFTIKSGWGAGVIAGSLIDPATIGNAHIRIHAMEGQLFWMVRG